LLVTGINDSVDGVYVVKDKLNNRFKNRVDILVNKGELRGLWKVKIKKI